MLNELLRDVCGEYAATRGEDFKEHSLAEKIRTDIPRAIKDLLQDDIGDFIVKGSPGQGQWAEVPWVAIFDPAITDTAMSGYYPVLLFDTDGKRVHLSLNQGTTSVRAEFRGAARDVLSKRADLIRDRVKDFLSTFPTRTIHLDGERLGRDYAAGHALGLTFTSSSMPDDDVLAEALSTMLRCYRALSFRGGLDFSEAGPEGDIAGTVDEQRKYRKHRSIERNPKARKLAKAHHGTVCQVCNFDYTARYGDLGEGFIEVHHLVPLSKLREGEKVSYDIAKDFAVLCASCHRMIHRRTDTADLAGLRTLLR